MKLLTYLIISTFIAFNCFAGTKVRDLNTIIAKATPRESKDLGKLLGQVILVPAKDPQTGKACFKITKIEKGSVYEREGLKVGDLVSQ